MVGKIPKVGASRVHVIKHIPEWLEYTVHGQC